MSLPLSTCYPAIEQNKLNITRSFIDKSVLGALALISPSHIHKKTFIVSI